MAYTTIDDPSAHFQIALWTGSSGTDTITFDGNSDLQLDWLWSKSRSNSHSHALMDTSRITSGDYLPLFADTTDVEQTFYDSELQSITSDGFTVGTQPHAGGDGKTYVGFAWKANGGTTSSDSNGSITSTVQANTTAGFSIATWTGNGTGGATIGHGLGSVPNWYIVKKRSGTDSWPVYHHKNTSAPETDYLHLDETIATVDSVDRWNDTAPTSTVVSLGDAGAVNGSGATYVGYFFCEKQGYSKFGSYTGNGSQDGPFVYTGFKPQWIMFKNTGAAEEWVLQDTTRNPNNPVTKNIRVDSDIAEADASALDIDFLSNGFKNRSDQAQLNSNGVNYIYMAFAEHPFVSSEGVPVTAR